MSHNNNRQQSYTIILHQDTHRGALLLADIHAASDQQLLQEYNVRTIITAASGLDQVKVGHLQSHIIFPLADNNYERIDRYFQLSYQTIEHNLNRGSVLVHCTTGNNRSATLVIAYYMKKNSTSLPSTFKFIKRIRPTISPILPFQMQLRQYEQLLGLTNQSIQSNQKDEEITDPHMKKRNYVGSHLKIDQNAKYKYVSAHELPSDKKVQVKKHKTWNPKESGLSAVTLRTSSLVNPQKHSSKKIFLSHLDMDY